MSRPSLNEGLTSPFTGLFTRWGEIPRRPHDPDVACWAGLLPRWSDAGDLAVGGAGWTRAAAEAAALGEAVERCQPWPAGRDGVIEASCDTWPLDEPVIEPARWVLFSAEQYAQPGFPFTPLDAKTRCAWVCCRDARGEAAWVPAALVYLAAVLECGDASPHSKICPGISTGLAAGRRGEPVLLRGLREVIERDALVGAWWGRYPLREYDPAQVWASLPADIAARVLRANLRWRFYRIDTPLSSHVTLATLSGDDHEDFCFSVGSACRGMRAASWEKSILEAVQSRHYVRYLRRTPLAQTLKDGLPADFAGHALYYSLHPDKLRQTPLSSPRSADDRDANVESLETLSERLAPRPILARHLTPPSLVHEGWVVLRVLVPGLQPLHGHHAYPFLGGPLWSPRSLEAWRTSLPHPYP